MAGADLLRVATAGSVDDGKSTLIGRLLYDSKLILEDQLEHLRKTSARRGDEVLNLALLTDGLRAEREQGITIDVAYRYFSTPRRKFILADTPGHVQYTRNMVTGASTADLALILIDAQKGVVQQSRRHAVIASLLRVPHFLVCINKMDLVDFDQAVYERIRDEFTAFAAKLDVTDVAFIPVSALHGDNVVTRSERMPWYAGGSLLNHMETLFIASDRNLVDCRFPVQLVVQPTTARSEGYRGYAGQVAGGVFKPGDEVVVLPSDQTTTITAIDDFDGPARRGLPAPGGDHPPCGRHRSLARRHDLPREQSAARRPAHRRHGLLDDGQPPGERRALRPQAHDTHRQRPRRRHPVSARHRHPPPRGRRRRVSASTTSGASRCA